MRKISAFVLLSFLLVACTSTNSNKNKTSLDDSSAALALSIDEAKKIIELPLHCIEIEYPNKLGQVLGQASDLKTPKELRPIFYGCFDWHSSVHGFWSIVTLMQQFPELDQDNAIRNRLNDLITAENCAVEIAFFDDVNNRTFERTYGWAWLFQLHAALIGWDDPDAQKWARVIEPLADKLIERYTVYLPKLMYPIRTGTHDNTAFSLSLTLDYARQRGLKDFEQLIEDTTLRLYAKDVGCNLAFEPSGHDFLSPCLEEARLMSKIMNTGDFRTWMNAFLPSLFEPKFDLNVAVVSDRTDGHLVHLDGLNFSRATCLNELANSLPELHSLKDIATKHFNHSFANISGDDYMGSHWLGTFALYTLIHQ